MSMDTERPDFGVELEQPTVVNEDTFEQLLYDAQQAEVIRQKNISVLSETEEAVLARGQKAEALIVDSVYRFIPFIVSRLSSIRREADDFEDFVQIGYEKLVTVTRSFDPSTVEDRDEIFKYFRGYVVTSVKREIFRCLNARGLIRLPEYVGIALNALERNKPVEVDTKILEQGQRARNILPLESGRGFGSSREGTSLDGTPFLKQDPIDGLEAQTDNEEGWPFSENYGLRRELNKLVNLAQLTDRERMILDRRFNEDMTLQEIGDEMGITKERVRHIESKIKAKLRSDVGKLGLRTYLDIPDGSYTPPPRINYSYPEPLPRVRISEELTEEIDRKVSRIVEDFGTTPRIIQQIIATYLNETQKVWQSTRNLYDTRDVIYERLHTMTDEEKAELVDRLSTEDEITRIEDTRLAEARAQIPELLEMLRDLRITGELEKKARLRFAYGSEDYENAIQKSKEREIEIERVDMEIGMLSQYSFRLDHLQQWLYTQLNFYDLPQALSISALDASLELLEDVRARAN